MRIVTKEDADRTEHVAGCCGYEDCDCFYSLWSHRDVYDMQTMIDQLASCLDMMTTAVETLMAEKALKSQIRSKK
jgi:hypothetical protein